MQKEIAVRILTVQKADIDVDPTTTDTLGGLYALTVDQYAPIYLPEYIRDHPDAIPAAISVIAFVRKDGQVTAIWDELSGGWAYRFPELGFDLSDAEGLRDLNLAVERAFRSASLVYFPRDSDGWSAPDGYGDSFFNEDLTTHDAPRVSMPLSSGSVIEIP